MIKNMLMAASKMLKDSNDEKVVCAKVVIDEIVSSMIGPIYDSNGNLNANCDLPIIPVKSKAKQPLSENAHRGKVTVEHGRIKSIEGVDLETTMIDLDGKQMTCAEAIGKPFQNGKIL